MAKLETLAETITSAVKKVGSDSVLAALTKISEMVREDGQGYTGCYPLRFAPIARHLAYLAMAIDEKLRTGKTTRLKPRWTELNNELTAYRVRHPEVAPLISQALGEDAFESFAGFSTRRQGSRDELFYVTVILLIVDLFERGYQDGDDVVEKGGSLGSKFDKSFLNFALPEGERDLPERLRTELLIELKNPGGQRVLSAPHPSINVSYTFKAENLPRLKAFVDYFASPQDGCAHFICYRPRYENPNELVKSFIAIKPPDKRGQESLARNKQSFGFVHLYQQPDVGSQYRISLGEILPLEDGLCFVGGQRIRKPEYPLTALPLGALKVIVIPWNALDNYEKVFSGLAMSATYQRRHIVSCLGVRATPIHHSGLLDVRPVPLKDLQENLLADAKVEATMPGYDDQKYKFDAASIAKRIAVLTNNNPTRWEVPSNYRAVSNGGADRTALERHEVDRTTATLGSYHNPKFTDSDGGAFDFWTGLRFAPLSAKE